MTVDAALEEIAQLRAMVTELSASRNRRRARSLRRRRAGLVGAVALAVGAVVGVAGATPTTSTTDVAFTPLTAGHKVLSSATIGANKTTVAVVSGASTTVPSNATTVKLIVSAKGGAAGVLDFYPTGNLSGGSGQTLSYPSGNVVATTTIEENVGQSNELTFANSGSGSVSITATVTAYSTQVTAGDIGGTGGTAGQVLTNNGAGGADWRNPSGAAFASTPQAFDVYLPTTAFALKTITSVSVPAGTFWASATGLAFNNNAPAGSSDYIHCYLFSPGGRTINDNEVGITAQTAEASMALQGLVSTTGGSISLECYHATAETGSQFEGIYNPSLVMLEVSSGTGNVTPFGRHVTPVIPRTYRPVSVATR